MSQKEPMDVPQRFQELTDEEKEALIAIIHDRIFWHRAMKKVKFLSSIVLGLSGLVAAITYLLQQMLGGPK